MIDSKLQSESQCVIVISGLRRSPGTFVANADRGFHGHSASPGEEKNGGA
jgi:hypothetical protein